MWFRKWYALQEEWYGKCGNIIPSSMDEMIRWATLQSIHYVDWFVEIEMSSM